MPEITWSQEEFDHFDYLTRMLSSRDQMDRIGGRLDMREFEAKHGKEKCDAMFAVLKERDAKAKA